MERFKKRDFIAGIMVVLNLDLGLRAQLAYSESPYGKLTLVYVPGFGTVGNSSKRFISSHQKFLCKGIDINLASFTYKSHLGQVLSGFENDSKDLGQLVEELENIGIPRNKIGLMGACYGSYVMVQYLQKGNDIGFAILIEPYLGTEGLIKPLRGLAQVLKKVVSAVSLTRIPLGFRYNGLAYFDLDSFLKNDKPVGGLKKLGIPTLVINIQVHPFFDHTAYQNLGENYKSFKLDHRKTISEEAQDKILGILADFLARNLNSKFIAPKDIGAKTPSKT